MYLMLFKNSYTPPPQQEPSGYTLVFSRPLFPRYSTCDIGLP